MQPPDRKSDTELYLMDTSQTIENRIEIHLSKAVYQKIKHNDGTNVFLGKPLTLINGDTVEVKKLHTRGKSTLYLRRKSYSFSLKNKASLNYSGKADEFKKFYSISLNSDKNYIRNRLAFGLMKEIQLFELFYSFCEIRINETSEGIYLLIERPQDWALKKKNSPMVLRRGYGHKIEKIRTAKNMDKTGINKYKNTYQQIYKTLNKYEGKLLYDKLSEWIDLELYMKWLSFNFLIRNGDYTDEVYFYIDPVAGIFKIIPWDYDDIFATQPHEGREGMRIDLEAKFIFSGEDLLDRKIALDPFLYQKYLFQLKELLDQLTPFRIKLVFEQTYAELYPFYIDEEIIGMSRYDAHQNVSINSLSSDLKRLFSGLLATRANCIVYLKNNIK